MKEYFKYANGYVNIDEQDVFLTNSGNWSETLDLQEKSTKTIRQNNSKRRSLDCYLFIILLFICFAGYKAYTGAIRKEIPFALMSIAFFVYRYFRKETGNSYRIPLSKIKEITVDGSTVKIIFLNQSGEEDFETLPGVDDNGIRILTGLQSC